MPIVGQLIKSRNTGDLHKVTGILPGSQLVQIEGSHNYRSLNHFLLD